jgi:hypothetical protein
MLKSRQFPSTLQQKDRRQKMNSNIKGHVRVLASPIPDTLAKWESKKKHKDHDRPIKSNRIIGSITNNELDPLAAMNSHENFANRFDDRDRISRISQDPSIISVLGEFKKPHKEQSMLGSIRKSKKNFNKV